MCWRFPFGLHGVPDAAVGSQARGRSPPPLLAWFAVAKKRLQPYALTLLTCCRLDLRNANINHADYEAISEDKKPQVVLVVKRVHVVGVEKKRRLRGGRRRRLVGRGSDVGDTDASSVLSESDIMSTSDIIEEEEEEDNLAHDDEEGVDYYEDDDFGDDDDSDEFKDAQEGVCSSYDPISVRCFLLSITVLFAFLDLPFKEKMETD